MLAVAVTAVGAVTTQLRCVDAAAQAARAAARGEDGAASAARVAPSDASTTLSRDGRFVRATVVARVHPLGGWMPGISVSASTSAEVEPGEVGQ